MKETRIFEVISIKSFTTRTNIVTTNIVLSPIPHKLSAVAGFTPVLTEISFTIMTGWGEERAKYQHNSN